MAITVKSFDKDNIKELISKSPSELKRYIKALETTLKRQEQITQLAVKKLKESQQPLPSEFNDIVNKNFWNLI